MTGVSRLGARRRHGSGCRRHLAEVDSGPVDRGGVELARTRSRPCPSTPLITSEPSTASEMCTPLSTNASRITWKRLLSASPRSSRVAPERPAIRQATHDRGIAVAVRPPLHGERTGEHRARLHLDDWTVGGSRDLRRRRVVRPDDEVLRCERLGEHHQVSRQVTARVGPDPDRDADVLAGLDQHLLALHGRRHLGELVGEPAAHLELLLLRLQCCDHDLRGSGGAQQTERDLDQRRAVASRVSPPRAPWSSPCHPGRPAPPRRCRGRPGASGRPG